MELLYHVNEYMPYISTELAQSVTELNSNLLWSLRCSFISVFLLN